ncbi:MAG: methylated-DNA--[protein]-cysteine S-methyltransferase [Burkholderiales bacterium]|nr:methylated-DNA--[protein]-cysteine S-methyltransferase [Burkholderiales bacterium]
MPSTLPSAPPGHRARGTNVVYAAQTQVDSPLGPILLARTSKGLAGLWFKDQKDYPGLLDAPRLDRDALLQDVVKQLDRYWTAPPGRTPRFDVPLDLIGTPFQQAVWHALLHILPGQTCSYGHIAQVAGRPQASRAVGAAVGRNPVSIIVPCHRVVGQSAQLTGYSGGMHRKIDLLQREGHSVDGQRLNASTPRS